MQKRLRRLPATLQLWQMTLLLSGAWLLYQTALREPPPVLLSSGQLGDSERCFVGPPPHERITTIHFLTLAHVTIDIRWNVSSTKRAVLLLFNSLLSSQTVDFHLHVYTNSDELYFNSAQERGRLSTRIIEADELPTNPYSDPWKRLSRAKLDFYERLKTEVSPLVWIDIDTLVFVDLHKAFEVTDSWVIGYHHGACDVCSDLFAGEKVDPAIDVQGDVWSLSLDSIQSVRNIERQRIISNSLPRYDLQGYFSIMLRKNRCSLGLLHELLPEYNFGFQCTEWLPPNATNVHIRLSQDQLVCPLTKGVAMGEKLGIMSFSATSYQSLFLCADKPDMKFVHEAAARAKFKERLIRGSTAALSFSGHDHDRSYTD